MSTEFTSSPLPAKLPPSSRWAARLQAWQPWFGPMALLAVSVALELGGSDVRTALRYDRAAIGNGELWRLLTGNLVHLGWWHLLLNGLSLVLLVMLCPDRLGAFEWLRRILLLCLGMSAGLYFLVPGLATYVGLSGMVYGLFVLGLGRQAVQRDGIAVLCLLFLAGRIGWELVIGAPESETNLIGGGVVAESHLYGCVAAVCYGLAFGIFRRKVSDGATRRAGMDSVKMPPGTP